MSERMRVQELKGIAEGEDRPFEAVLLHRNSQTKVARNGAEFLFVELGDASGAFTFTCFSDNQAFGIFKELESGRVVRVEGVTAYFAGRFNPKVNLAQVLSEEQAAEAMKDLVESAPEDPGEMWSEFEGHIEGIEHVGLRETVRGVFEDLGESFRVWPAAISMHHAYRHGLLEHTLHVVRAGLALLPLYPEVHRDLAVAGMLVHDTGKVLEYTNGAVTGKTRTGQLNGHVVLGYRLVRKAGMKAGLSEDMLERLEHIVLSHQGELEWGAAVMAATPEAVFVSMVDNLDAKMGMVQKVLRDRSEGVEFSERLMGLKSSVLLAPVDEGGLGDE